MYAFVTRLLTLVVACAAFHVAPARAQFNPMGFIGRCDNDLTRRSYDVFPNLALYDRATGDVLPTVRDPSGMTFLRLPSAVPTEEAVFLRWDGVMVSVTRLGVTAFGRCGIAIPPQPIVYFPPPPPQPDWGVISPSGQVFPVPQQIADLSAPFTVPMLASADQATACFQQADGDRNAFAECMITTMAGERERAIYECGKAEDHAAAAICMVGVLGGAKERAIARDIGACYAQEKQNWMGYPLCMAGQANPNNDAIRLLACVQSQYQTGGQVTPLGTAMCYGVGAFQLNPEMQIAVQCAVATDGQPYAFAACAGGQLTARELDKCFTNGVGGDDGCFGKNNTLIHGLDQLTDQINATFGPTSLVARGWANAVSVATLNPGPNSMPAVAVHNVGREIDRAGGNVMREAKKVLPRFRL